VTTRRQFLLATGGVGLSVGTAGVQAQLAPNQEALRQAAYREALRKVVGGAPVRRGKVKLDVPPLIDNGNSVALSVAVQSPMTRSDHVKAIHVFAEKNPQPNVVSAYLGPRAGRASISTRVRLADTQTVIAIAQLSDGSFWSDSAEVVVTLGACLEEGLI
jgi:sulfur-oxidizing protein SoxY